MTDQQEFFSPKHKQLLSIATWSRYLAWVVLVVYILWAIATFINYSTMVPGVYFKNFFQLWGENPSLVINALFAVASTILRGVIAFVVLKAVSLGLNMIVETDINYREKENQRGVQ